MASYGEPAKMSAAFLLVVTQNHRKEHLKTDEPPKGFAVSLGLKGTVGSRKPKDGSPFVCCLNLELDP